MSIIIITKEIRQYDEKSFQIILTRARKNLLNNNDITIPNNKVLVIISISNPDKQIVIS